MTSLRRVAHWSAAICGGALLLASFAFYSACAYARRYNERLDAISRIVESASARPAITSYLKERLTSTYPKAAIQTSNDLATGRSNVNIWFEESSSLGLVRGRYGVLISIHDDNQITGVTYPYVPIAF